MDANDALNVFEQRPVWERLAINVALCFQLNKTADERSIVQALQDALDRLANSSPVVAGQVVTEGASPTEGNIRVVKIVPRGKRPGITVRDHRQTPSVPSLQSLGTSRICCRYAGRVCIRTTPCFRDSPFEGKASTADTGEFGLWWTSTGLQW
jgi:hypothetical protein